MKNILFSTNAQKILHFLIDHSTRDFLESEIQKSTKVSKSGVNYAFRDLVNTDFLVRSKRGRTFFYTINDKNLIIKQLKIIETLYQIEDFLNKIKSMASKIVLFGSSSRGENTRDSDIDLLIISRSKDSVQEALKKYKGRRKLQPLIFSNVSFMEKKKTDPIFYDQVNKGIVLCEGESYDV